MNARPAQGTTHILENFDNAQKSKSEIDDNRQIL